MLESPWNPDDQIRTRGRMREKRGLSLKLGKKKEKFWSGPLVTCTACKGGVLGRGKRLRLGCVRV